MTHRVLIVDDDLHIREVIRVALRKAGMTVFEARDGKEALTRFAGDRPDLIILDIGMPEFDGLDVCREIRKSSDVPILFLSARDEEIDRVLGLEIGGDDYVTKPFSPRELAARVRAILRRTRGAPVANGSAFEIDTERLVIRYHATALELSRYEYRLLAALIARPGRVFSRAQLMDAAWEEPEASMERTVDTHIKSLRAKLHAVRADADPIRTHRGFGYSLET